ncbi:MAG: GGDEF domain-containing protein [Salinarimonadaceae bacterium]|nr:MAG: GGDEF domain-containing protein [Salinarimonadaceae bacterium]
MGPIAISQLAAIAMILVVMAGAFYLAGRREGGETYWRSWCLANLLIASAIVIFIFERHFPPLMVATLPNLLLVLGFSLRLLAARQFSGRAAPAAVVLVPVSAFVVLGAAPVFAGDPANVFMVSTITLGALAGVVAFEFWRDRADRLPSRYVLIAAYGVVALSFLFRAVQVTFFDGMRIEDGRLQQQEMLVVHLMIAIFHVAGSGAFALSLAYERGAARLRHVATHDSLTGLMNRGAFEAAARERIARREGRFAVALLDIDHFKRINDLYGHAAGDAALRACADTCRRALRPGDILARVGGEEFAVIIDDLSMDDAAAAIERIRAAVAAHAIVFGDKRLTLTVSAGLCHSDHSPDTFDALMRAVDDRLYEAKRSGRNRIVQATAA